MQKEPAGQPVHCEAAERDVELENVPAGHALAVAKIEPDGQ